MRWLRLILACLVGACLAGCTTTLGNQGETGIRYGTEITLFSRATKTCDEKATANVELPALMSWLFEPNEPSDGTDGG